MLGAIAGDIIGSLYEGMHRNIRTTEFPLFRDRSHFTDDTVLTVAVADAILHGTPYYEKLKEYYGLYPGAGYSGAFKRWARSDSVEPYNSFGNGSAMRVSAAGFAFDSIEDVLSEAKKIAEVTHNHPEGIRGAQATAAAVFMARTGAGKEEIRQCVQGAFGYDLSESIDSLRTWYALDYNLLYISCQKSVPPAIIAFLDSEDFEDAIRKVVSIGGDTDTLACITGGIAEAFYGGVPRDIQDQVVARLDERLSLVLLEFTEKYIKRRG
jgi:ADP-ribosylglycohydrolase